MQTCFGLFAVLLVVLSGHEARAENNPQPIPRIYWESDPVQPNETVLVIGDDFSNESKLSIQRLANSPTAVDAEDREIAVEPSRVTSQAIAFVVPDTLSPGVFRYSLSSRNWKVARLLNAPRIYWVQGNGGGKATTGGWIRLFGRNLMMSSEATVELEQANSGQRLTVQPVHGGNNWDVRVDLAQSVEPGLYRVRVWNGMGDRTAWSDWTLIEIHSAKIDQRKILNVRDFGARGDGVSDDTAAIQNALNKAAASGGSIVLLPQGRYLVSKTLNIGRRTALRGESRASTSLAWIDFDTPPPALMNGQEEFEISDLSLYASNHQHIISGGNWAAGAPLAADITLERLTIRASAFRGRMPVGEVDRRFKFAQTISSGGPDSIRVRARNLRIVDCDVYGSGRSFFLSSVDGAYIGRNRFYNGRWGWYSVTGSRSIIF